MTVSSMKAAKKQLPPRGRRHEQIWDVLRVDDSKTNLVGILKHSRMYAPFETVAGRDPPPYEGTVQTFRGKEKVELGRSSSYIAQN